MFFSSIISVYSSFFYALKAIWQRRCRLNTSSSSRENIIDAQNEDLPKRPRAPTPISTVEYEDPNVLEMSEEVFVVPSSDNDAMISMQEGRSPHLSDSKSALDPSESSASPDQLHPERNLTVRKHPREASQDV